MPPADKLPLLRISTQLGVAADAAIIAAVAGGTPAGFQVFVQQLKAAHPGERPRARIHNRALTFGLYSLLRISQVFHADWRHFKAPDHLWVPGIKGQEGRWITLHPKALTAMGPIKADGPVIDYWQTLPAFREAVYKKVKREKLHGVRFHETKHTGISALLEAGYSVPEVCKISGNSYRTIAHYAHVNEQRVYERWKSFEYGSTSRNEAPGRTAAIQHKVGKQDPNPAQEVNKEEESENGNVLHFSTSSQLQTVEN